MADRVDGADAEEVVDEAARPGAAGGDPDPGTDDEVDDDPEDTKVLERDVDVAADDPDYDASDDPITGAPSALGDAYGPDGELLSPEELKQARVDVVDTGALPLPSVPREKQLPPGEQDEKGGGR